MATTPMKQGVPSREEVLAYFAKLSNWGRWGKDDQLGTLNFITPDVRLRAIRLVTEGKLLPLGMDLDPENPDPIGRGTELTMQTHVHSIGSKLQGVRENIQMMTHGSPTHLDAPSHFGWNGQLYNGFPAAAVTDEKGASKLSVHNARDGIVTRGVLLDIAGLYGVDWIEPATGAFPKDLDAAEKRQGVRVEQGDVLIINTGFLKRVKVNRRPDPEGQNNGYHAACLPWLHERGVSVIASDALNDIQPSGYGPDRVLSRDEEARVDPELLHLTFPVHAVALVAMGAWIVDNVVLDELLPTCARLNRWEFLIAMAPLRWVGATGSQVNPFAIF